MGQTAAQIEFVHRGFLDSVSTLRAMDTKAHILLAIDIVIAGWLAKDWAIMAVDWSFVAWFGLMAAASFLSALFAFGMVLKVRRGDRLVPASSGHQALFYPNPTTITTDQFVEMVAGLDEPDLLNDLCWERMKVQAIAIRKGYWFNIGLVLSGLFLACSILLCIVVVVAKSIGGIC